LPGGGGTTPSPVRTERTTVRWVDADLPQGGEAGYGEGYLPLSHLVSGDQSPFAFRKGMPTLVYLSSELDEKKALAFEDAVFADDRVALASHFFNCLRVSLDDAPSERIRKQYGSAKGPSLVFLDGAGKELKRFDGWRTSGVRVYTSMGSVLKATRKLKLTTVLRKENAFLKQLDELYWKIEDAKFDLGELAKRKGNSAQRQAAKVKAEIAKLQTTYEGVQKKEDAFLRKAEGAAAGDD